MLDYTCNWQVGAPVLGPVPSPDGMGFCCPIAPMPSCDCFPSGGFAETPEGCDALRLCDAAPPGMTITDPHGCEVFVTTGSCLARDAGLDAP
jgi:hypothetical protein